MNTTTDKLWVILYDWENELYVYDDLVFDDYGKALHHTGVAARELLNSTTTDFVALPQAKAALRVISVHELLESYM